MDSKKLCPICGKLMDKNSYFKKLMCHNNSCGYAEDIKYKDQYKAIEGLIDVLDEVLYYVEHNTSSDLSKLVEKMYQIKTDWYEGE